MDGGDRFVDRFARVFGELPKRLKDQRIDIVFGQYDPVRS